MQNAEYRLNRSCLYSLQGNGDWLPTKMPNQPYTLTKLENDVLRIAHLSYYTTLPSNDNTHPNLAFKPLKGHVLLPDDQLVVHSIDRIHNSSTHRTFHIKTKDDVSIDYDGGAAYCTVERILLVSVGIYRYLWIYPRWWWNAGGGTSVHRIRKTKLVKRSQESSGGVAPPSPADKIKQQACRHDR